MDKGENGTIFLNYQFDSDYAKDEEYGIYEGDEFGYEIGIEEAKETLICNYLEITNNTHCPLVPIVEVLDALESEGLINWEDILFDDDNVSVLKDHYRYNAMGWFIEKNYIMTKEDYEANQADAYNDEKWLEEHGE